MSFEKQLDDEKITVEKKSLLSLEAIILEEHWK